MSYGNIEVHTPSSREEAVKLLAEKGPEVRIVAGGTEVMVELRDGIIRQNAFMDISKLQELRYVRTGDDGLIHIGALTTLSNCLSNSTLADNAPILVDAIRNMASVQVRNVGTIGGNIANASPAGDTIPPLYVQTGKVVLSSVHGERMVNIEEFFLGPNITVAKPYEMITEIQVKPMLPYEKGFFKRISLRRAHACSVASVACWLKKEENDLVRDVRIALGAVSPTVIRARGAEKSLKDGHLTKERLWPISEEAALECMPIADVRASIEYRRSAIAALTYRGLLETLEINQENT